MVKCSHAVHPDTLQLPQEKKKESFSNRCPFMKITIFREGKHFLACELMPLICSHILLWSMQLTEAAFFNNLNSSKFKLQAVVSLRNLLFHSSTGHSKTRAQETRRTERISSDGKKKIVHL